MSDQTRAAIARAHAAIVENAKNPQPGPKDVARHCADLVLAGTKEATAELKGIVGSSWADKLIKLTRPQRAALADPAVEPFSYRLNIQHYRLTKIILVKLASIRCNNALQLLAEQPPSMARDRRREQLDNQLVKLARQRAHDWQDLQRHLADISREMTAIRVGAAARPAEDTEPVDDGITLDEQVDREVGISLAQAGQAMSMGGHSLARDRG